jgi:hypothetical protein
MDCAQPTGSRALDVLKDIVEENNAFGRHSDCLNNELKCLSVRLSQPDIG